MENKTFYILERRVLIIKWNWRMFKMYEIYTLVVFYGITKWNQMVVGYFNKIKYSSLVYIQQLSRVKCRPFSNSNNKFNSTKLFYVRNLFSVLERYDNFTISDVWFWDSGVFGYFRIFKQFQFWGKFLVITLEAQLFVLRKKGPLKIVPGLGFELRLSAQSDTLTTTHRRSL